MVKAKKTNSVKSSQTTTDSEPVEECPDFHESFSILFPPEHLDRVSCIISLCGKTGSGTNSSRFNEMLLLSFQHQVRKSFWEELAWALKSVQEIRKVLNIGEKCVEIVRYHRLTRNKAKLFEPIILHSESNGGTKRGKYSLLQI